MKIAFVGKGGSGKTTLSALFSLYLRDCQLQRVLALDADLNMHLPELLGFSQLPYERHLSHPAATAEIKTYLKGQNSKIATLAEFRKTTPPGHGSRLLRLDVDNKIFETYGLGDNGFRVMVVGTYDTENVGTSCYHNNLSIAENVLTHTIDDAGVVVADMVAGVDAFANTMHAQFDLLVLAVEPTKRGIEVFEQYSVLAKAAGTEGVLFVVGNKVRSVQDVEFIQRHIPKPQLLGYLYDSPYLRLKEQQGGALSIEGLELENRAVMEKIYKKLVEVKNNPQARLGKMWELHKSYVNQAFIRDRFGDLTGQIDINFRYDSYKE